MLGAVACARRYEVPLSPDIAGKNSSLPSMDFLVFLQPISRPFLTFLMHLRSLIISAAALVISTSAHAHGYQAGDILIAHPYARPTVPGQTAASAYLTMENKGMNSDRLVSIASPAATSVEIHTMSMDGDIMRMREVSSIEIKPATAVTMKPGGGYHIMLLGIKKALKPGEKVPLTLTFEKSGHVDVSAVVKDVDAKASKEKMSHHHHK